MEIETNIWKAPHCSSERALNAYVGMEGTSKIDINLRKLEY